MRHVQFTFPATANLFCIAESSVILETLQEILRHTPATGDTQTHSSYRRYSDTLQLQSNMRVVRVFIVICGVVGLHAQSGTSKLC